MQTFASRSIFGFHSYFFFRLSHICVGRSITPCQRKTAFSQVLLSFERKLCNGDCQHVSWEEKAACLVGFICLAVVCFCFSQTLLVLLLASDSSTNIFAKHEE